MIDPRDKNDFFPNNNDELFDKEREETDEMESDGSASAFDETESVNEDNFDRLSDK